MFALANPEGHLPMRTATQDGYMGVIEIEIVRNVYHIQECKRNRKRIDKEKRKRKILNLMGSTSYFIAGHAAWIKYDRNFTQVQYFPLFFFCITIFKVFQPFRIASVQNHPIPGTDR